MIFENDPYLLPYREIIERRYRRTVTVRQEMAGYGNGLSSVANNHLYYGVHPEDADIVFREYAPNATALYLIGDFNSWEKREDYRLSPLGNGNWELRLPRFRIPDRSLFKWWMEWEGGAGERIPAYARRCVQDPGTKLFSAQVWLPSSPYRWKHDFRKRNGMPLIYEVHIGMSSEAEKISTFEEFRKERLPYIAECGYDTIQIMALQEHPYYGSYGYQVSSFFALSSRFGTPEEFKRLVDDAHGLGIAVVMDIVHSHSVDNEAEGLGRFDGTDHLYFHSGPRGRHPAWNSRCFDYGKECTLFFLLSNLKFWLEEYRLDGFRFDGVTSMIYLDHGIGRDFPDYPAYFDGNQDEDALLYLSLANLLVKEVAPSAITIAEDVSGLPGLAAPVPEGGIGFDFRLSMGIADRWIRRVKEKKDEEWSVGEIYRELTDRRKDERSISYVECHDQALVGDQTLIFRLMGEDMYGDMNLTSQNFRVDRAVALHKMIRLVTIGTAGSGYLNFMGNEFGHPEWIDFPREGNGWSYLYARRQWSLVKNADLRYRPLLDFDRDMIRLVRGNRLLMNGLEQLCMDDARKILIFVRGGFLFAFNFHPSASCPDFRFRAPEGKYLTVLDSDARKYDGFGRLDDGLPHFTERNGKHAELSLYLPSRTAVVLKRC